MSSKTPGNLSKYKDDAQQLIGLLHDIGKVSP